MKEGMRFRAENAKARLKEVWMLIWTFAPSRPPPSATDSDPAFDAALTIIHSGELQPQPIPFRLH